MSMIMEVCDWENALEKLLFLNDDEAGTIQSVEEPAGCAWLALADDRAASLLAPEEEAAIDPLGNVLVVSALMVLSAGGTSTPVDTPNKSGLMSLPGSTRPVKRQTEGAQLSNPTRGTSFWTALMYLMDYPT